MKKYKNNELLWIFAIPAIILTPNVGLGLKVDDPMEHFVGTPAHKPCDEIGEAKGANVENKNNYFLILKLNLTEVTNIANKNRRFGYAKV
ncbi:hypothetical protein [Methanotorris igneus]|uniref:Uncharacterized protein n=1 Tax=Methanotorris igneus (strain DSM 5666 / JCM 11834 / Kol 5) TaxID=880724 RepID=F6BF38_METIK|nr:hypothetical protein [Methanotorris igneus]AEF96908.1 hypothetical protein Metig_1373 [Methanotorris igneus Kol 5]